MYVNKSTSWTDIATNTMFTDSAGYEQIGGGRINVIHLHFVIESRICTSQIEENPLG